MRGTYVEYLYILRQLNQKFRIAIEVMDSGRFVACKARHCVSAFPIGDCHELCLVRAIRPECLDAQGLLGQRFDSDLVVVGLIFVSTVSFGATTPDASYRWALTVVFHRIPLHVIRARAFSTVPGQLRKWRAVPLRSGRWRFALSGAPEPRRVYLPVGSNQLIRDVRFWPLADKPIRAINVAIRGKADGDPWLPTQERPDRQRRDWNVRQGPTADIDLSLTNRGDGSQLLLRSTPSPPRGRQAHAAGHF